MKSKLVMGIVLALLFVGMLTFAFNIESVKASGTIYIKADGSVDPPTANITSADNVTYYFTDNNYAEIVVERSNIIVDGNGYTLKGTGSGTGIDLTGRSNVTIRNMEIVSHENGIYLDESSNNSIYENNITENHEGIRLKNSSYNSISGNKITTHWYGIYLCVSSSNNSISGNNITDNYKGVILNDSPDNNITDNSISRNKSIYSQSFYPIELTNSCNNDISANNIVNSWYGIKLWASHNCSISGNYLANNNHSIELTYSSNNSISGNKMTNNYMWGMYVVSSSNNIIFHNDFINNTEQVYSSESTNTWDDGYPSGGNYWSDYTGVDLYSGPYQNETDSDGIGDTPYVIDENNADNYPLMKPWTPTPLVVTATIDIHPGTLNLKSKGRWITCYIELPESYDLSAIDRATILLNGTIPVDLFWLDKPLESVIGDYDDDGILDLMVKFSRTEVSEYIHCVKGITQGNAILTIAGELYDETLFEGSDVIRVRMRGNVNSDDECADIYDIAIPEFPSLITLPLFMIATLLAVIVYRRHSKKYQINS